MPVGSLDPDCIHLPSIFVNRLILGAPYDKKIEFRRCASGRRRDRRAGRDDGASADLIGLATIARNEHDGN